MYDFSKELSCPKCGNKEKFLRVISGKSWRSVGLLYHVNSKNEKISEEKKWDEEGSEEALVDEYFCDVCNELVRTTRTPEEIADKNGMNPSSN